MAIQIPSLDDRTYEQLLADLRRHITPGEWTDHNASDPGIMLIEELCWLGEMALYRMDRVPDSHLVKFLNFLIDPPEPVTIVATFIATFGGATTSVPIPAGTLLATEFVNGRRFVFETFQPLTLTAPPIGINAEGSVEARAILEVFDEVLGNSDGTTPNQTFLLRPPRQALGIAHEDTPAPVLTDFVHVASGYQPNPRIRVGGLAGVDWTPVPSLRTERSRVTLLNPAEHYMVESFDNRIRFGDGVFGAIPPAGEILCTRYAVLDGPAALTVKKTDVKHLLNFAPPSDVPIVLSHTDAEGGANFFAISRRFELGLAGFRARFRLVTERDFELSVTEDFNAFQRASNSQPEIRRAAVVVNRRPPLSDDVMAPGHVTFVLFPDAPYFDEAVFQDETVALSVKEAMVDLPPGLWGRLRRFLDKRRLITTRLHQQKPELKLLAIAAVVAVAVDRNAADMELTLRRRVHGFLSLLSGDFDGRGWQLGRDVYRSQLFRILEDVPGVDHVASLSLAPADADGNVAIGPQQLPLLQTLTLAIVRG